MKSFTLKSLIAVTLTSFALTAQASQLILVGDVADKYVDTNTNSTGYERAAIVMDQKSGMIEQIIPIVNDSDIKQIQDTYKVAGNQYIELRNGNDWDVIYPGAIDLHNHTKQNNLGVWAHAHGQFANRFEWRAWSNYKYSVSGNMNPWIGYGKAVTCAAFRWSEIQAMVVGTTYLQGPSSCVKNFAINQVEDKASFKQSKKDKVQAPTDLVIPADMVFVWQTLKPLIDGGLTYEQAMAQTINEYCDTSLLGKAFTATDVMSSEGLAVLKDKEKLVAACTKKELPNKFIRYVYWVHKSVAGKKQYADEISKGNGSAIIAHLAEGRRDDFYNQREYEVVKLLGMNKKGVNFVHAVGLSPDDFADMEKNDMGIIWSPFSNMLLYNQTLDVATAAKTGVLLAMGSDWLPTGSKGPLEEIKIAREYIDAAQDSQTIKAALINDPTKKSFDSRRPVAHTIEEALFNMVTENPAKMINHWQNGADDSRWQNGEDQGGVGTIATKAMGSLVVTTKFDKNDPFANYVNHVWETDINLVTVDGNIKYGNQTYVEAAQIANYEAISSNDEFKYEALRDQDIPVLFLENQKPKADEKESFMLNLTAYITVNYQLVQGRISQNCNFSDTKVFVQGETKEGSLLANFNLDTFQDIQRILGTNLMTQARNQWDKEKGNENFIVSQFTPLYTCNDPSHTERVKDFISKQWPEDRHEHRDRTPVNNTPKNLAEKYQ